jgi:hypothetical protein
VPVCSGLLTCGQLLRVFHYVSAEDKVSVAQINLPVLSWLQSAQSRNEIETEFPSTPRTGL